MTRPIGFSTGAFWKYFFPGSKEVVDFIKDLGCDAIELSATTEKRITSLLEENLDLSSFTYISAHGPGLQLGKDEHLATLLKKLCKKYPIQTVTFHPDKTGVALTTGLPAAFENMDRRKQFGKRVADFNGLIPPHGFVLDVNHIMTIDPTLKLADEFKQLYPHMCHIHASGMKEKDGFLNHHPIFLTQQNELFSIIPDNTPIIIESEFDKGLDISSAAKKEFEHWQRA